MITPESITAEYRPKDLLVSVVVCGPYQFAAVVLDLGSLEYLWAPHRRPIPFPTLWKNDCHAPISKADLAVPDP